MLENPSMTVAEIVGALDAAVASYPPSRPVRQVRDGFVASIGGRR